MYFFKHKSYQEFFVAQKIYEAIISFDLFLDKSNIDLIFYVMKKKPSKDWEYLRKLNATLFLLAKGDSEKIGLEENDLEEYEDEYLEKFEESPTRYTHGMKAK